MLKNIERLPPWARPAAIGALVLAAMTSLRVILLMPSLLSTPARVGEALLIVIAASASGAAAGFGYSLTRPTLKRLGRPGDYLSGIVCMLVLAGSVLLIGSILPGEPLIAGGVYAVLIGAALFGLILGHVAFRKS